MKTERIIIAPSILAADFTRFEVQIRAIEEGGADWVHIDVMDGQFVPNITFGPVIVKAVKKMTSLPLDVHLMVHEPDHLIPAFVEAGANRLTVHVEAIKHIHRTLSLIKELGANSGVTLNPGTSASTLDAVMEHVDLVLVMTVNPGYGGQSFIHSTLKKIEVIAGMINEVNPDIYLEVDGGIDTKTAPLVTAAGADALVAGTAVFRSPDIAQSIDALRK
ncbi:MAG: ribulose-phosphate 3-epimerase [candidate division KSB1 bacterium]|jgi:ribulose-phosphate 3-epimerase|nr:ribulose-phosphate 3-epimerase [candidate division KSB1 bacterium]